MGFVASPVLVVRIRMAVAVVVVVLRVLPANDALIAWICLRDTLFANTTLSRAWLVVVMGVMGLVTAG